MSTKVKLLILWILLLTIDTGMQLLIKTGAEKISFEDPIQIRVIIGLSLYLAAFMVWMQILKYMRLSIALALTSLLFITVPTSSFYILGEEIKLPLIIATVFIIIGVVILGISEGKKEE
jgi:drug/metabolite transporter (DMT)-like permease